MPHSTIDKGTPGTPSGDTIYEMIDKLEADAVELYARPIGSDGKTVRSGTGAPASGLGVDGDFYIDTTGDKTIYGPKAGGAWGSGTTLKGAAGDTGPPGDAGPQGDPGSTGAPGADGKTIRSGTTVPAGGLGVDGDLYYKTNTNEVYGPKAGGSWGSPVSIIGPQGVQGNPGADGKTLRSGSGAPAGGLGVDGDFYINTAASTIYGPKASGAWGSPTSIVGPQGNAGTAGNTVLNGTGAPAGGTGVNGDYYIRNDTSQLYGPKAGGTWPGSPVSLVGPQGNAGAAGRTVLNGTAVPGAGVGVDGDFYIKTDTSQLYGPKAAGAWPGSPVSLVGPQGGTGSPGANGNTILNGTTAPGAGLGANGDFYINTNTEELYGPKTAGAWGSPTSLVGPQGTAGASGTTVARLTADVTTSGTANAMTDITGLSFAVVSGQRYYFRAIVYYTSAATTGGSRWSINGPAATMKYRSEYSLTTTTKTYNDGLTGYDQPAAANATSALGDGTSLNLAIIEGIIAPSANGTVIVRGAREVAGTAIVAKVDSFLEFKAI